MPMKTAKMFKEPGQTNTWGVMWGKDQVMTGESYQVAANVEYALNRGPITNWTECDEIAMNIKRRFGSED
jgi:hypothetical protein